MAGKRRPSANIRQRLVGRLGPAIFAALASLLVMSQACKDIKPKKGQGRVPIGRGSGEKVKLEFYVMSKCPFGVQVENAIAPLIDEMGDYIDLSIDFIVNEQAGKFSSLHGEPEVQGNLLQLCAIEHNPDPKKYMPFISCQNKNMRDIPKNWEKCAESAGLDAAAIRSCYSGSDGKKLLRASMERAKKRQARGSPTIFLAGQSYSGGRSKTDFMRAICQNLGSSKPKACADIPEPIEVKAIVLTDKRCKECRHDGLVSTLRSRFFPKLTVRAIDYNSAEGKKLYKNLGLKYLPAFLFQPGVKKAEKYQMISRWMNSTGKYQQLKGIPAKFDPTAEICDNGKDDTGNGKVDCKDATCKAQLVCRKEKKNVAEVFIMSQCPYGVKAVDAIKQLKTNFGSKLKFDIHYIADLSPKSETGFSSLHGQAEVRENIRQLCAKKYYAKNDKYLDYLWCRNKDKNYRSEEKWEDCATNGISAAVIRKCAGDYKKKIVGAEGKKLLAEDLALTKMLGISGSPTWLCNNRFKFNGIAANGIKDSICKHNGSLPNCDKKLASDGNTPPAGSCK